MTASAGTTAVLYWSGLGFLVAALIAGGAVAAGDTDGVVRVALRRHAAAFDASLRFLRARINGRQLAAIQLATGVAGVAIAIALDDWTFTLLTVFAVLLPGWWLQRARQKRITRVEAQLDGWLVALANAMEASPSLGHALPSSAEVTGGPLAEEVDVALKQMQLGTPLDAALLDISRRLGSRPVAGGIAALLVARQTGGDLPSILRRTAASLREMTRLEGVLRRKTADSRNQAYVLLLVPLAIVAAIHQLDAAWLEPLGASVLGWTVTAIAAAFWIGAVLATRFILAVDL